jgi:hypothetical protein
MLILLGLGAAFFIYKKYGDLLIIINNSKTILESKKKNTNRYLLPPSADYGY